MNKYLNSGTLKIIFIIIFTLSAFIQLIVFFNISEGQLKLLPGDAKFYIELVDQKMKMSNYYPDKYDEYSNFVWNPGFINVAMFLKTNFGSHKSIYFLNIICYLLSAILIIKLGSKIKNETVGYIAGILYLTAINNLLLTTFYITQVTFGFVLLLYALLQINTSKNLFFNISKGIILGIANWIRPFGFFVLLSSLPFLIKNNKLNFYTLGKITLGFLSFIFVIGFTSYNYLGKFIYQTTTSGLNMRMGAMEQADGGFKEEVYSIDSIENTITFTEKEKIRSTKAIEWILSNKIKFIKLMPIKIMKLMEFDAYSFNSLKLYTNSPDSKQHIFIKKVIISISKIRYYVYAILFFFGLYISLKEKSPFARFFVIFSVFTIFITILTVGVSLYRHHLILLSYPLAALGLYSVLKKIISLYYGKRSKISLN